MLCVATSLAAQSIKPGQTWNDTSGSSINAHGGCVVYSDGYYYWFGENRSKNKSDGISCYRSKDLISWTRLSRAVQPSGTMTDENRDIASGRTLERPKVIWNEATQKWVMWIHWENGDDYGQAKCAVCTASKVEGPYTLVDVFRPNGCDSRDQTLFLDADGQAYHAYSTNMNSNTNIERLTPDFLAPEPDYAVQLKGRRYEAAAIFRAGDCYYGLFSGCTGWNPNPGRFMWTYDLMNETWQAPADFRASDGSTGINFCVDNGKSNTYQSQSNFVFAVPGKDKCFIYMGDRWNSSDIQNSKHVWLPLSVRSGYPTVQWYDSWDLSVFDEMYRFKRLKQPTDGAEVYLLEKYSNRLVSRPKASLTIENDGNANLLLVLHTTDKPYTYKIEDKAQGKYLESLFGTTRWSDLNDHTAQEWVLWLEEDGYYRIQNAADGVCLSVSGNTTEAGTAIYLSEANKSVHQSFGLYFDSKTHADYDEADMYSKAYREANRVAMQEQAVAVGIGKIEDGRWKIEDANAYDLSGRLLQGALPKGIVLIGGKKRLIK
ncbi:MAG: RICIN domain-containing protein [Bacteroidaceae bacterium]|nr:RICIN domain-containing protein [Bacteroidaceae bacterium]